MAWSPRRVFPPDANLSDVRHHLHYYLFTPASQARLLPLVVYLHGGTKPRGRENGEAALPAQAFHSVDAQQRHPCYVLRPITGQLRNWVHGTGSPTHLGKPYHAPRNPPKPMAVLMRLLDATLRAEPGIDASRLMLVGASMGAYGVFDLLSRCPRAFASAVAIAGAGDPVYAPTMLRPRLWILHAADDDQVGVNGSRRMIHALLVARRRHGTPVERDLPARRLGSGLSVPPTRELATADGEVRYTEYRGGGNSHTASFYWTLGDPALADWAFGSAAQPRPPPAHVAVERRVHRLAGSVSYTDSSVAGWTADGVPRLRWAAANAEEPELSASAGRSSGRGAARRRYRRVRTAAQRDAARREREALRGVSRVHQAQESCLVPQRAM